VVEHFAVSLLGDIEQTWVLQGLWLTPVILAT
jgi:hypothetical protein